MTLWEFANLVHQTVSTARVLLQPNAHHARVSLPDKLITPASATLVISTILILETANHTLTATTLVSYALPATIQELVSRARAMLLFHGSIVVSVMSDGTKMLQLEFVFLATHPAEVAVDLATTSVLAAKLMHTLILWHKLVPATRTTP